MEKIIDFKKQENNNDMIPMEEWDGECWKTMFDTLAEMIPDQDPWETFANFIKETLMK